MSKLREAAQAAVEAFELHGYSPLTVRAIWNLRDALAEPNEIAAAVLAEREACAQILDSVSNDNPMTANDCADAIRARGQL